MQQLERALRAKFQPPPPDSTNQACSKAIVELLLNEKDIRSCITAGDGVKKRDLTLLLCDLCKPRRMDDHIASWWRSAKLATHRIGKYEHFTEPFDENAKEFEELILAEQQHKNAEHVLSSDRCKAFFARPEIKLTCKSVLAILRVHCTEGFSSGLLTRTGYDEHRTLLRLASASSSTSFSSSSLTTEKKRKHPDGEDDEKAQQGTEEEKAKNKKPKTNESQLSQLCIERICTREGQGIRQNQPIIKQAEFLLRTPRIRSLITQDGGMTKRVVGQIIAKVLNVPFGRATGVPWWPEAGLTWRANGNFHHLQEPEPAKEPEQGKEPAQGKEEPKQQEPKKEEQGDGIRKLLNAMEESTNERIRRREELHNTIHRKYAFQIMNLITSFSKDPEVRQVVIKDGKAMERLDVQQTLQSLFSRVTFSNEWLDLFTKDPHIPVPPVPPVSPVVLELRTIMKAYVEKDEKKTSAETVVTLLRNPTIRGIILNRPVLNKHVTEALSAVNRRDHTSDVPLIVLYNRAGLRLHIRPEDEAVLLVEKEAPVVVEKQAKEKDKEPVPAKKTEEDLEFLRELKEAEQALEEQRKAREAADRELKELTAKQEQQAMAVYKLDSAIEHAQDRVEKVKDKKSAVLQRIEQQLAVLQQQATQLRSS